MSALKGIANLVRMKTIKEQKTMKEEAPQERTAQNILKARLNPKKNASKQAKNLLNTLSASLKKQTEYKLS